jgi:aryl sulfotransferase
MSPDSQSWPIKTGDITNGLTDSTAWDRLVFRDDDIVVATYGKSGTTLTQQIVSQLVFDADPTLYGAAATCSPWVEATPPGVDVLAIVAAQTHRRILKTHLPVDRLVYSPKAKYITVGRDARDIAWSFHNHFRGMRAELIGEVTHAADGHTMIDADPDVRVFYHRFIEDGVQDLPFWSHIQGWWDIRHLPNLLTLHYADLISDLPGQVRRIAAFLDIPVDEAKLPTILRHCSLEHMRKVAATDPVLTYAFEKGSDTFIHKGTNGRWRDVLTQAEIDKCDQIAARELTPDCAAWLRDGTMA